jgi:hypothetical protein
MWVLERLLEDLRAVLRDPQADPETTIFLAAMAVVLVLITVAMLLILMASFGGDDEEDSEDEETGEDGEPALPPPGAAGPLPETSLPEAERPRLWPVVTLAAAVVFFALFFAAGEVTSRPDTCARCHALEASVESWREVGHGGAECLDCHGVPGAAGYLVTRLGAADNLLDHMAARLRAAAPAPAGSPATTSTTTAPAPPGEPDPGSLGPNDPAEEEAAEAREETESEAEARVRAMFEQEDGPAEAGRQLHATVENGRCLACHENVREGTLRTARLHVRHSDFLEAGARCTYCHAGAGHGIELEWGRRAVPTMGKCLDCHQGETAPATCDTCHHTDMGAVNMPDNYPKVRLAERNTCEGCHSLDNCLSCHRIEMPHPTGFADPQQHARPAAFERKEEVCYRCHEPQFCSRCHNVTPSGGVSWAWGHTSQWREGHQIRAGARCQGCHAGGGENMCQLCHDQPGIGEPASGRGS